MDRPDDEIELVENSGVVVEATIGHDVGFDSLEDAKSIETDIELVDLVELLLQLVSLETTSVERRLRVVGDTDVIPAALLCRERHLLDGSRAVGVIGVAVEDAAKVFKYHQVGELASGSGFDLTHPFAELGRNHLQIERGKELVLARHGDPLAVAEPGVLPDLKAPRAGERVPLLDVSGAAGGPPQRNRVVGLANAVHVEVGSVDELDVHRPGIFVWVGFSHSRRSRE